MATFITTEQDVINASNPMLALPNELLDKIFSYFDWDRSVHLSPISHRHTLANCRLVCRRMRDTVSPTFFRHLGLTLRWVDGALAVPGLFHLRREATAWMPYVHFIHVRAYFGTLRNVKDRFQVFGAPFKKEYWQTPPVPGQETEQSVWKERIYDLLTSLLDDPEFATEIQQSADRDPVTLICSVLEGRANFQDASQDSLRLGDDTVSGQRHADSTAAADLCPPDRMLRIKLDALALLVLCFPPSLVGFTFSGLPDDEAELLQYAFTVHMTSFVIRIYGNMLESLSLMTAMSIRNPGLSRNSTPPPWQELSSIALDELGHLNTLKSLTLPFRTGTRGERHCFSTVSMNDMRPFQTLGSTVTHVGLWYLSIQPRDLTALLRPFTYLRSLALHNVTLDIAAPLRANPSRLSHANSLPWLTQLIEIRRLLPRMDLHLRELNCSGYINELPPGAIRWLQAEAIPRRVEGTTHADMSVERELRLATDFVSFLPFWTAEQQHWGMGNALVDFDQEAQWARLADSAMSRRWPSSEVLDTDFFE